MSSSTVLVLLTMTTTMCVTLSKEQTKGDQLRTNYGVVFRSMGDFSQASSHRYHHFVLDLPKVEDVVTAMCGKRLNETDGRSGTEGNDTWHGLLCRDYAYPLSETRELFAAMNKQIIQSVKDTRELAKRLLTKLPEKVDDGMRNPRTRTSLMTADMLSTLSDTRRDTRLINSITAHGKVVSETLIQRENNFESLMELSETNSSKLNSAVKVNHAALRTVKGLMGLMFKRSMLASRVNKMVLARYNITQLFIEHMRYIQTGIEDLSRGFLSAKLISNAMIEKAVRHISRSFRKIDESWIRLDSRYEVLYRDPQYYYIHGSFNAYIDRTFSIWLTLEIPVTQNIHNGHYYKVDVYPVPLVGGSKHATKISGLPDYAVVARDHYGTKRYSFLTSDQLAECRGDVNKVCSFAKPLWEMNHQACLPSLLNDYWQDIHKFCKFDFYRNHIETSAIKVLTNSELLVYNEPSVCMFCIIRMPRCNRRLSIGKLLVAFVQDDECSGEYRPPSLTVRHLINLVVARGLTEGISDKYQASTEFVYPQRIIIPNIDFFEHEFLDYTSSDNTPVLDWKKMERRIKNKQNIFSSLSEYLLYHVDINDSNLTQTFGTAAALVVWPVLLVWVIFSCFRLNRLENRIDRQELNAHMAMT